MYHNFVGEDWWNLHEVRFDDTFTAVHYPLEWEDITIDGEDTVNEFLFPFNVADGINQDGKVVASVKSIMDVAILKERLNAVADALPYEDHYYTDEEWDYLNRIMDEEVIRGAEPRYWEDVQPMEELQPCTIGERTSANSYGNYVCVDIQKCDTVLGTGTKLFVKEENLEKL